MTSYGVLSTGFNAKRLDDVRASLRAAMRTLFGDQVNLTDDSGFSQFIDIFAGAIAENWQAQAAVYAAFDPASAVGAALENLAALSRVEKKRATASVGTLRFTGTPGTAIVEGVLVRSPALNLTVETTDAAVIGGGGTVDVAAAAVDTGPLAFGASTLTQLVNPVVGVSSVTNPDAFVAGRDVEQDEELRVRREASLQAGGSCVDRAVAARLRALDGVLQAFVYSNRSDTTDAFGFPQKSMNVVVWPSSLDADYRASIARIIDRHAPAGIGFSGDIVLNVVDNQGYDQAVAFRFAEAVDVYLQVDLTTDDAYPLDGDAQIAALLVARGNAYQVGDDARPLDLYAALASIAGIVDIVITLKAGSPPGPLDVSTIPISPLQIARFDALNIVVNSTGI